MGFGHRVYRAEDPRARVLRRTAQELDAPRYQVAEELEKAALAELRERRPDRVLETNVEFWAAIVLDFADVPAPMFTSMFTCARTGGWSAHILEQKRTGRLIRPSAVYTGPAERAATDVDGWRRGVGRLTDLRPRLATERLRLEPLTPTTPSCWSSSTPTLRCCGSSSGARCRGRRSSSSTCRAGCDPRAHRAASATGPASRRSGSSAGGRWRSTTPTTVPPSWATGCAVTPGGAGWPRRGRAPCSSTPSTPSTCRPSGRSRWRSTRGPGGVLARLGMTHVRTDVEEWEDPLPGAELGEVRYELTREEWRRGVTTSAGARPRRPADGTSAGTASSSPRREP